MHFVDRSTTPNRRVVLFTSCNVNNESRDELRLVQGGADYEKYKVLNDYWR